MDTVPSPQRLKDSWHKFNTIFRLLTHHFFFRNECADGKYSRGSLAACLSCPEGYECSDKAANPVLCPVGYYSDAEAIACIQCEAGYYCQSTKCKVYSISYQIFIFPSDNNVFLRWLLVLF